jgi:cytochrome c biogenesis protein CcmG, thiol:disulfide interchange protein DsbE
MKKNSIIVLLLLSNAFAFAQKAMPTVDLKNLEGKSIKSTQLAPKGKVTVINFWATWCIPCRKELDEVSKKYTQWQKDYNLELVAVTIDNAQSLPKVKPMVAQKGWKYTVISDINSQLLNSLGGQSVPYTVLLDKKGNIVYEHNGYKAGDELELEKKIAEYSKK